jgi:hypothetical protein
MPMHAPQACKLRVGIVLSIVAALMSSGSWVPSGHSMSQAWAGSRPGGNGHGHGDNNNDDRDEDRNRKKGFDHFACYTAAEHVVDKDVKIINQFTKDDYGNVVAQPIKVGELMLLCVPTKKILPEEQNPTPHR